MPTRGINICELLEAKESMGKTNKMCIMAYYHSRLPDSGRERTDWVCTVAHTSFWLTFIHNSYKADAYVKSPSEWVWAYTAQRMKEKNWQVCTHGRLCGKWTLLELFCPAEITEWGKDCCSRLLWCSAQLDALKHQHLRDMGPSTWPQWSWGKLYRSAVMRLPQVIPGWSGSDSGSCREKNLLNAARYPQWLICLWIQLRIRINPSRGAEFLNRGLEAIVISE